MFEGHMGCLFHLIRCWTRCCVVNSYLTISFVPHLPSVQRVWACVCVCVCVERKWRLLMAANEAAVSTKPVPAAGGEDSSESDGETEPAKSFHRRFSTNKNIKSSVTCPTCVKNLLYSHCFHSIFLVHLPRIFTKFLNKRVRVQRVLTARHLPVYCPSPSAVDS